MVDLEDPDNPNEISRRTDAVQTNLDDYDDDTTDIETPRGSKSHVDKPSLKSTPKKRSKNKNHHHKHKKHGHFPKKNSTDPDLVYKDAESDSDDDDIVLEQEDPNTHEVNLLTISTKYKRTDPHSYETNPKNMMNIENDKLVDGKDPKTDEYWGFRSIRSARKQVQISMPMLHPVEVQSDMVRELKYEDENQQLGTVVENLNTFQSHHIPDPYNTTKFNEPKPDFTPTVVKKDKVRLPDAQTVEFNKEPVYGMRSLYSTNVAKIMAKSQAQRDMMEVDNQVYKNAEVEYEIYQDDYRLPRHRFYKRFKEHVPEDYYQEKENWIPCAQCFDTKKEADKYNLTGKLNALDRVKANREKKEKERIAKYGKGTLFNRMFSCACGMDNSAGHRVPGWKPPKRELDNEDMEGFSKLPDFRKRRPSK